MALQHVSCHQHLVVGILSHHQGILTWILLHISEIVVSVLHPAMKLHLGRHPRGPGAGGTPPWFLLWLDRIPLMLEAFLHQVQYLLVDSLPCPLIMGAPPWYPPKLVHLITSYPHWGLKCLWTDDIHGWRFHFWILSGGGFSPASADASISVLPSMGNCVAKHPMEDECMVKSAMSPHLWCLSKKALASNHHSTSHTDTPSFSASLLAAAVFAIWFSWFKLSSTW